MANIIIRPLRIDGNTALVALTRGYVAVIDAADVDLVAGRNWTANPRSHTVYAQANVRRADGAWTRLMIHRQLMVPPAGIQVDHIDGDGLNNRRCNLRLATHAQNGCNRRTDRDSTSGLKGIWLCKRDKNWHSRIMVNNKRIYLGQFDTADDAHKAYCIASAKYHGEFGRTK